MQQLYMMNTYTFSQMTKQLVIKLMISIKILGTTNRDILVERVHGSLLGKDFPSSYMGYTFYSYDCLLENLQASENNYQSD